MIVKPFPKPPERTGKRSPKEKKKKEQKNWKKLPVIRFIDPYSSYNLYGDIVLPTKFWHNKEETVYPLELFLDYKTIRQIHFRENGIIFELEDFNENELSSIKFLQERLRSLGDQHAWDLANFLEFYSEYFENDNIPVHWNSYCKKPGKKHEESTIFDCIDKVFDSNKENLVFMRGNKNVGKKDFRSTLLCFNFKIISWLTKEKNIFSAKFIKDCFRLSYYADFQSFINIFKNFCFPTIIDETKGKLLTRSLNTLVGKINMSVKFFSIYLPKSNFSFQYWVHSKENFDEKVIEKLKMMENSDFPSTENVDFEKKKKDVSNYSDLIKSYYCLKK